MNLRALRKLVSFNLIKLVLALNVVCFVCLSLRGLFSRQIHTGQVDLTLPCSSCLMTESITTTTTATITTGTTTSHLMMRKLEQMRRAVNDSRLLDPKMFPGRRIGRYLLLNPELCRNDERIDIIIIVHTATANLERRQRIRDTFAQASLFRPFEIRTAFLLGRTANKTLERILWFEHVNYNDTVMGDFHDDYHNLTLKGVMGYRWVSEYCPQAELVLKVDDDVLVNMFKLLYSFMGHMTGKKKSIFCNLWFNGTMPILRQGKWKVEPHVFASWDTFPYDYCSGFLVILTSDLMGPMYRAALSTPFFWIDDVYLFGMLPTMVGDVTYYNFALDKNLTLNEKIAINCTRIQGPRCPIFATAIVDRNYWPFWNMIQGIYAPSSWNIENKVVH